jgi:hypothetical protein
MMDKGNPVVVHGPNYSNTDAEHDQHTRSVGWADIIVGRIEKGTVVTFGLDQSEVTIRWAPGASFSVLVNQLIICSARAQSFWTACRSTRRAH